MGSYSSGELSKQLQTLCLTELNSRSKDYNYDEQYFPKARRVQDYVDKSPQRYFWLRHPSQATLYYSINLIKGTKQFNRVANPIKQTIGSCIEICNVYKIVNKFLERQYELKKELKQVNGLCKEYRMYHFTVEENVDGIITNNFNWRLSGLSRGHKYGYGISFSPDLEFAQQFCKSKVVKALFVVKVLVSSTQAGKEDLVLPDAGFDTTVSPKKNVYVKFEDSEFYPEYLVYYYRIK